MRINDVDPGISYNMGGNTLDIMIMTSLIAILAAIVTLINEGISMMQINTDVDLWSFLIWSIFIALLLAILNRLIKAVNN